jgi:hypothetical protein
VGDEEAEVDYSGWGGLINEEQTLHSVDSQTRRHVMLTFLGSSRLIVPKYNVSPAWPIRCGPNTLFAPLLNLDYSMLQDGSFEPHD